MNLLNDIKKVIKQKPIITLLIIAFFFVFFNLFLYDLHLQNYIFPDSNDYYLSAQFLYNDFRGHAYRPILFALITGIPIFFTANKDIIFNWVILLNFICWLGSIVLLFKIISNFISLKFSFLLTIIFICSISNLFFVFHYLTETILVFMLLAIIFYFQKFLYSKKYKFLIFSLAILLSSVLIKPMTTYLAVICILIFIPFYLKNIKNKYNFLIYICLLLISIQLVGMKAQFGNFTISYIDKVTIHNYLFSKSDCLEKGIEYQVVNNPRAEYLWKFTPIDQKKITENDMKFQFYNNINNVFIAYLDNLFTNIFSGSLAVYILENKNNLYLFETLKSFTFKITKFYNIIFILTSLFFGLWYFFNFQKYWNIIIIICTFFTFYVILVSGISSNQGDRFHIVVYPFILILTSFFISKSKIYK
ncbi:MAG: hypothetical protein ACOVQ2_02400 [Flavobacterium sp.]